MWSPYSSQNLVKYVLASTPTNKKMVAACDGLSDLLKLASGR